MIFSELCFKAYLDNFDHIHVILNKTYYNGVSLQFYLRDVLNGEVTPLQITDRHQEVDAVVYDLKLDQELEVGHEYQVTDAYGMATPLVHRNIVYEASFDEKYADEDFQFGAIYTKEATTFRIWAPTALEAKVDLDNVVYNMHRVGRGSFEITVSGDLSGKAYTYLIKHSFQWVESTDPYSYSLTANGNQSVVIDLDRCCVEDDTSHLPPLNRMTDAIIYELSVRDISWQDDVNKGKFAGLKQHLNYLKELGVTHLQLMPTFDFATVDENHPSLYYNWGYDVSHHFSPEGIYASNIQDGYCRIIEMKEMIRDLHQAGFRVVLDVVYNHMYNQPTSHLDKIVPRYYFRRDSNGSYCGNDIASERTMGRFYILESCKYWMREYHIDGFRFDLMGILDIETCLEISEACLAINPNAIFYGEGWKMPTRLPQDQMATIENHEKLPMYAFFNDRYREVMKAYCAGNTYQTCNAANVILGCDYLGNPRTSINYVECHDNETYYDKLTMDLKEDKETLIRRMKLANGMVLLSQGIPFIHCGQEFCRTKNQEHNTYNLPDYINQVDWYRRKLYRDVVSFTRDMIYIRKKYACFRMEHREEVERYAHVDEVDYRMLVVTYTLGNDEFSELKVYVNPSPIGYTISLDDGKYVIISDMSGYTNEPLYTSEVVISPISIFVLGKKKIQ